MPTFNWIGKDEVANLHREVPFRLLEKIGEVSEGNGSQNLILQGDNLEALKAIMPYYVGKIKCIYIDPPYNTGNENWVYNDNTNSPLIREWLQKVVDRDDLCRHDKWLCMMMPRLLLMKDLLAKNGVIFISIDDNELANLKLLCDEIFSENNLLGIFTWVRKKKGSNLSKTFRKITEYILCYRASDEVSELYGSKAYSEKDIPLLNRANPVNIVEFPANRISFAKDYKQINNQTFGRGELAVELLDDILIKDKVNINQFRIKGRFRWSQERINDELENGSIFKISEKFKININSYSQQDKFKPPISLLNADENIGSNENATDELRKLFPNSDKLVFDYPKPVSLIKYLIASVTGKDKNAIILDSMAGSGTTGQAVMELNEEDGGNRKFILIEMEYEIARKVTAERIRHAINKFNYKTGFDYYELGGTFYDSEGQIDPTTQWGCRK